MGFALDSFGTVSESFTGRTFVAKTKAARLFRPSLLALLAETDKAWRFSHNCVGSLGFWVVSVVFEQRDLRQVIAKVLFGETSYRFQLPHDTQTCIPSNEAIF